MADAGIARIESQFRASRRLRRRATLVSLVVLVVALVVSARVSEAYPRALLAGLPRVDEYFVRLAPTLHLSTLLSGPKVEGSLLYWFYRWPSWLWMLFETSQMALLGTLAGAVVALPACFAASINLAPNRWVYRIVRRCLELLRSVPDIVYALIFVWAFGIGPLAGILAIALHTIGALGKQFAEVVENADMGPWDGARASGGTWVQCIRFAILPQVLPNIVSYVLLRFEINVRGATVIGFVGAGGIGQELYTVISLNYYDEVGAIIVMIIAAVMLIDICSEQLRQAAIGRQAA